MMKGVSNLILRSSNSRALTLLAASTSTSRNEHSSCSLAAVVAGGGGGGSDIIRRRAFSSLVNSSSSTSSGADLFFSEVFSSGAEARVDEKLSNPAELGSLAVDLKRARPGDEIKVPYEVTVSEGLRDFWQASFYSHDRLNTSTPFARAIGFQDQVLPFSLMCYLAGAMSHADAAVVQVAYRNAKYLWPGFAGDTFTKVFRIKSLRTTSDGCKSTFEFICELVNQRGKVCFTTEKQMIFPFLVSASTATYEPPDSDSSAGNYALNSHIIKQSSKLAELGGQSLKRLRAGQVILHGHMRPLSEPTCMNLSSLARLTHPRHFNKLRYRAGELLVPGGLVLSLALSLGARELHEVLHEELKEASFVNQFHPGDVMASISYIDKVETHVEGVLEKVHLNTIGIKNYDIKTLEGTRLPLRLLKGKKLRTKEVEKICKEEIPDLAGKVVVHANRTIMRHAPKMDMFLL